MYGSPCMESLSALRSGDTSRISLPLAVAGALNGALWGAYGASTGIFALFAPNSFGAALSLFNIAVKLGIRTRSASPASASPAKTPRLSSQLDVLRQGMEQERPVLLSSFINGCHLRYAGLDIDVEDGVAVQVVPRVGGHVALTLDGARFLCVRSRLATTTVGTSAFQPSAFFVTAARCSEPDEDGLFLPVHCGAMVRDPAIVSSKVVHDYYTRRIPLVSGIRCTASS